MKTVTFGQQLQAARKARGLTQEALAEQLGVSRQAVAKWENDKAYPDTGNLFAVSELLGVTAPPLPQPTPAAPAPAEPTPPPPQKAHGGYIALGFAGYTLALAAVLQFAGLVVFVLALLVPLGVVLLGVPANAVLPQGHKIPPRRILGGVGFVLAAALAAVLLWCAALIWNAHYEIQAVWGVDLQELEQYPALNAWAEESRAMGDGIYTIMVDLPDRGNGIQRRCLVYRCGVTDGAPGRFTRDPLHYRMAVHYSAAQSGQAHTLDLLTLSAQRDYSLYCLVQGNSTPQDQRMAITTPYEQEMEQLFAQQFG